MKEIELFDATNSEPFFRDDQGVRMFQVLRYAEKYPRLIVAASEHFQGTRKEGFLIDNCTRRCRNNLY